MYFTVRRREMLVSSSTVYVYSNLNPICIASAIIRSSTTLMEQFTTHPCSVCRTISPELPFCLPDFPPSTTNRSSWKNWLTTVCLCGGRSAWCTACCRFEWHLLPLPSAVSRRLWRALRKSRALDALAALRFQNTSSSDTLSLRQLRATYLEHLQLLQTMLHQLLYPPRIALCAVLPECIPCSSLGVLAEVVCGELA